MLELPSKKHYVFRVHLDSLTQAMSDDFCFNASLRRDRSAHAAV